MVDVVALPCDRPEEWSETQKFILLLSQAKCLEDFSTLISSAGAHKGRGSVLRGFQRYVKGHCSPKERSTFFKVTLPGICRLASQLPSLCPAEGIPFVKTNEEVTIYLSKRLVASLLANCLLCTFPGENPAKGTFHSFTFESFFNSILQYSSFQSCQAARLKCILVYFEKIALKRLKLTGYIKMQRKVLPSVEVTSMEKWWRSKHPLCSLRVETEKKIEDCGALTLQVDFANSCIGGGTLHCGCVQEEIRFTICPELIVSMLIMGQMQDNEAIIIQGFERCSNYRGYGSSFAFAGECYDDSQRDELDAPMTCVVAIDALMVDDAWEQFTADLILRELNKAFVGFLCTEGQGDLQRENLSFLKARPVVVVRSPSRVHELSQKGPSPAVVLEQGRECNGKDIPLPGIAHEGFQEVSIAVPHTRTTASPGVEGETGTGPIDTIANFIHSVAAKIVQSVVHRRSSSPSVRPASTAGGPSSVEGTGDGQPSNAPLEENSTERRSSLVQFALDPKSVLESESMASTLSQVGSDPDPSAISTTSRYSSRSSSLTGQPLIIGEYAELLSQAIVFEVGGSLGTRAAEEVQVQGEKEGQVQGEKKGQVQEEEEGQVQGEKEEGQVQGEEKKGQVQGEESDSSKTHDSTAPEPTPELPVLKELTVHVASDEPPLEFAAQLSQRLMQAAVQHSAPKVSASTPMRAGSHSLIMDRLRGPVSLESGRLSAKWSNAPTMDQDSSPPSPGELDAMAMDYANDISEYANLLVFKCLADTIRSLTGCEMQECFDDGRSQNEGEDVSEEPMSLPSQKISQWAEFRSALLRPVVTGNWGCGAFGGDAQLKAMLQWMAVSLSGRPELVYCTFRSRQLQTLPRVVEMVEKRGMNVGQVAQLTLKCCEALANPHSSDKGERRLFSMLIRELS